MVPISLSLTTYPKFLFLLIELIRYRTKLPHDLYKEVLNNYKKMQDSLNIVNLYKYTKVFNQPYIIKTIISEIL